MKPEKKKREARSSKRIVGKVYLLLRVVTSCAEKIAGDAQPKIATGSARVNFHHPYVIKYQ